ncbi:MAG: cupin-like domain-containing protein [Candidatus Binatia bacterium]
MRAPTPVPRIAPLSLGGGVRRRVPAPLAAGDPSAARLADWPAMRKWSLDYFQREFGDRQRPVIREKDRSHYDVRGGLHYERIRFGDYCALLADERPHDLYLTVRVHEALPELFADIRQPVYTANAPWARSRLWFGAPDTKGPLHRDLAENLYAQVRGRKRFLLLDRKLTRRVHRHAFHSGVPNYSPVDAEQPDLARFPRFRDAPLWAAELEAGDLLYIPSLWWHQARSLTTSIAVNLWWLRGPKVAVARLAELYMRLRGLQL